MSAADRLVLEMDADTKAFEAGLARANRDLLKHEALVHKSNLAVMDEERRESAEFASLQARNTAAAKAAAAQQAAAQQAASKSASRALLAFGAVGAVAFGMAAKAAINWESSWAGVTKTVNGSEQAMAALESGLRGLATTLPASHDQIAAVAEAAGALGVKREAILGFTRTMIDLGETTDLSADEAATSIAQLANVMGTNLTTEVNNFGSALVALGNDGASTETQILEMAKRIGGAGAVIGLSEQEVLAFGSALSSAGIEAEAGGSAISKVFIDIASTVKSGGEKLETFATVSGLSAAQFTESFENDPARAMESFITGLGNISDAGGNTFGVLDELGLSEIRTRDALLRLSESSDLLGNSLNTSNEAWSEANALAQEAAKRYETAESKIKIARNQITDSAIDIGGQLLPALASVIEALGGMADLFGSMPEGMQTIVTVLGAIVTVGALAAGAILRLGTAMGTTTLKATAMKIATAAFSPWTVAITAATIGLGMWAQKHAEAKGRVEDLTAAIEADSGALGENTRLKVIARLEAEGLLKAAATLGLGMETVTDAALGNTKAMELVNAAIEANIDEFANANAGTDGMSTNFDEANSAAVGLRNGLGGLSSELELGTEVYKRQQAALGNIDYGEASINAKVFAESMGPVIAKTQALTPMQQELADKVGLTGTQAVIASEALDGLDVALRNLLDQTFDVEEAQDAWHTSLAALVEQVTGFNEAVDENGNKLHENGAALDDNSEAALANREKYRGLVDQYADVLSSMAEHGAGVDEINAKAAEMRGELDVVAEGLGINTEATGEYDEAMRNVVAEVTTTIYTPGLPEANAAVNVYKDDIFKVPFTLNTIATADTLTATQKWAIYKLAVKDATEDQTTTVHTVFAPPSGYTGSRDLYFPEREGAPSGREAAPKGGGRVAGMGTLSQPVGGSWAGGGSSSASYDYSSSMQISGNGAIDYESLRRYQRGQAQRARAFAGARS